MGLSLVGVNNDPKNNGDRLWLKRQAIQIASQLPEDRASALAVLEYARILMTDFMLADLKPDA